MNKFIKSLTIIIIILLAALLSFYLGKTVEKQNNKISELNKNINNKQVV